MTTKALFNGNRKNIGLKINPKRIESNLSKLNDDKFNVLDNFSNLFELSQISNNNDVMNSIEFISNEANKMSSSLDFSQVIDYLNCFLNVCVVYCNYGEIVVDGESRQVFDSDKYLEGYFIRSLRQDGYEDYMIEEAVMDMVGEVSDEVFYEIAGFVEDGEDITFEVNYLYDDSNKCKEMSNLLKNFLRDIDLYDAVVIVSK